MTDSTSTPSLGSKLDPWFERDLTADVASGAIAPAGEIDDTVDHLCDLLAAGRHPIVIGERGVGKSTHVAEIARRIVDGRVPDALAGHRVLQFSIRHRLASLKNPKQIGQEMAKFVRAIAALDEPVIPFLRDVHLAYHFDLESHLEALAFRLDGPIIGEGDRAFVRALFEYEPNLEQLYQLIDLDEPGFDRARRLAATWNDARPDGAPRLTERALDEVVDLTHRFLARARHPRKTVDFLEQVVLPAGRPATIDAAHVIERFCALHRVPRELIDPEHAAAPDELTAHFRAQVLGQDDAVDAVVRMITLIQSGMSDPRRAFGVFLFVGPTGVGKTHLAKCVAERLFADRRHLVRLNMADYAEEASARVLFGDPTSCVMPSMRGVLTQRLLGHPFAVLLLDEFEKADPRIHDRFMQMFDEGQFVNAAGETVSCRSMVIIATSNAGSEIYRSRRFGFEADTDHAALDLAIEHALESHFRVEFINRFDRVVRFVPLGRESLRAIARRELVQLTERVGVLRYGHRLAIDDALLDWLARHGHHPQYGARFLRRTIERDVATVIAETLVRANARTPHRLRLGVTEEQPTARLEPLDAEPDLKANMG